MPSTPSSTSTTQLLSLPAAARVLGCSPQTLRRLIHSGAMKAIDIGTRSQRIYRLVPGDLMAFVQAQSTTAAPITEEARQDVGPPPAGVTDNPSS